MRVSHALHIDAPPESVWRVTVDIERWPEWTPTVTSATRLDSGALRLGSRARLSQPMQPPGEWVVTRFEPMRAFAWETHRRGLRMCGTHELHPEGNGTGNVLHVDAEGVLAVLLWPLLRVALRRALADENRGLKQRCER
jgi:uncharacterized protein YndB with AHSA1/START domain